MTPIPATATPTATRTPIPTNTPATSCTNLLANPSFESGRVKWTDSSLVSSFYLDDVQLVSGNACIVSADSQDVVEPAAQDSGEDIPPSTQPKP